MMRKVILLVFLSLLSSKVRAFPIPLHYRNGLEEKTTTFGLEKNDDENRLENHGMMEEKDTQKKGSGGEEYGGEELGRAELGRAKLGMAELGNAKLGRARHGRTRLGIAKFGRPDIGNTKLGMAWHGRAWLGMQSLEKHGMEEKGMEGHGLEVNLHQQSNTYTSGSHVMYNKEDQQVDDDQKKTFPDDHIKDRGWIQDSVASLTTWVWTGGLIFLIVVVVGICLCYRLLNRYGDNIPLKDMLSQYQAQESRMRRFM